ncbi:hypothetical protein FHT98_4315 [Bosea sp. AK1]|uniref:Ig-like domain-containing protein n=1 Tax=Bosea sp. AK1 TaxID=2587160 RepID=UPI00114F3440|nr:Ig-like domain-containing protein [Bosea sp. AK1]TQI76519.1 hypothetical protein FHT98_4315 [Bosea sp. AK1]
MRVLITMITFVAAGYAALSSAQAACTGTNGRGWGTGNGAGQFEMSMADKTCRISFPGVINETAKTRIPATQVTVTRAPGSGKVAVTRSGLTYTPNKGFQGSDTFCTSNTTPKVPGVTLSGCITVTVR